MHSVLESTYSNSSISAIHFITQVRLGAYKEDNKYNPKNTLICSYLLEMMGTIFCMCTIVTHTLGSVDMECI